MKHFNTVTHISPVLFFNIFQCSVLTTCTKMGNSLKKLGSGVNECNESGYTKLMKMVQKGDIRCVNALIKAGADVNKSNRNGFTPLHIAVRYGIDSCIKLLVKAGADVNFCAADTFNYISIQGTFKMCTRTITGRS